MTDDNSNTEIVDIADDLDTFEKDFFQTESSEEEAPAEEEEVEDTGDDAPATDEDTDASEEDEDSAPDEEDEDEGEDESEEEEEEPAPKPKGKGKKSAQERINELTREKHENARRAAAIEQQNAELLRRLEALEAGKREDSKQEPIQEKLPQGAPKPDAVNDKGEPKYPLGEFDPAFIADLTTFTIEQKTAEIEQRKAAEAAQRELTAAQEALRTSWNEKLEAKEEENPEIRENITELAGAFQNIDPNYGEYLAMTIMQSEVGPDIMEYLSQNIGEARQIVASGPAAATLALGRLEARLSKPRPEAEEKRNNKKVSNAPEPPEKVTRGRKGQTSVRADTDDLDAFERVYFKK